MSFKTTSLALALTLGAVSQVALADSAEFKDRSALRTLSGEWRSSAGEDWGRGTYGTRAFTFKDGRWSLRFQLALDPGMNQKVFEFRTNGTYDVQKASPVVPGAYETLFREEKKEVTLLTKDPKLAEAFGLAACGLKVDVATDISVTGCSLWKPVAVCGEDHDLLALDKSGRLYFGVRPADNDMCTPEKRPTQLLPAVVKQ